MEVMILTKRIALMPRDLNLAIRMRRFDKMQSGWLDSWKPEALSASEDVRELSFGPCEL